MGVTREHSDRQAAGREGGAWGRGNRGLSPQVEVFLWLNVLVSKVSGWRQENQSGLASPLEDAPHLLETLTGAQNGGWSRRVRETPIRTLFFSFVLAVLELTL